MEDLIERLEKSAGFAVGLRKGIGNYIKNVTNIGVNRAQQAIESPKIVDGVLPSRSALRANLHNAKVDRNIARTGTAAAGIAAGAGLGGYAAYQKSQEPVVNDLMQQNQYSQNDQFNKSASEELTQILQENLLERLEKTAAIAYVPVEVPDPGDQDDIAARQQAEVAPLPQPNDPTQPQQGIDPSQLGITAQDEEQEGPVNSTQAISVPAENGVVGETNTPVNMDGTAPVPPEHAELQAFLEAQKEERANESPGQAENEEAKANPRQGAGSVSNAPAGEDKTAAELIERLEKAAAGGYEVDSSPSGGFPGDKSQQAKNYWHKLTPEEVREEDGTIPNNDQKALFERLTQTAGGYDSASQAANLSRSSKQISELTKKAGEEEKEEKKEEKDEKDETSKDKEPEENKDKKKESPLEKSAGIPGLGLIGKGIKSVRDRKSVV